MPRPGPSALTGVALLAIALLAISDSWRAASLAVVAAGAVLVTRIRFSPEAAVAIAVVVAAVSVVGHPLGTSARPSATAPAGKASQK